MTTGLFRPVEVARQGEFDFEADLSKRKAFLRKNALIGHRSISLQSVCAKITSSRTIAVERHSAQKLHSFAIALLQIFDLFFAGSRVATRFCDVTYVPYLLRTFYSERSEFLIRFNRDFGGGHGGHFWISRSSGSILQRFGFKPLVRASRVGKIL